ncbi:MAG: hypothetical protein JZU50_14450, partial [Desulfobulbaceae bacterium]|nr:hypothetical protein [Desulfobulbaceae bacterium]
DNNRLFTAFSQLFRHIPSTSKNRGMIAPGRRHALVPFPLPTFPLKALQRLNNPFFPRGFDAGCHNHPQATPPGAAHHSAGLALTGGRPSYLAGLSSQQFQEMYPHALKGSFPGQKQSCKKFQAPGDCIRNQSREVAALCASPPFSLLFLQ